ncbi:hypothetical protein SETIT_8G055400v2 [Setaria italica]|uniref:Uncharacterized protein n=1 Tax=Setaria italica TaxID=4555 RepID=A0A368S4T4_SETIT|nr:hypothetical protein SETIT_8G055400v2 [Setaria italica]
MKSSLIQSNIFYFSSFQMENSFVRQFCSRRTLQSQHEQNDISRATNYCEKYSKWSFHITIWTYSLNVFPPKCAAPFYCILQCYGIHAIIWTYCEPNCGNSGS